MPRPKGSKNKSTKLSIDEKINAVTNDIDGLMFKVKEKKTELRRLRHDKVAFDRNRIMDAVVASGKSCDEVVSLLSSCR